MLRATYVILNVLAEAVFKKLKETGKITSKNIPQILSFQHMQKLLMGYVAFSHTITLKQVCILQEQHISIPTSPILGAQ